MFLIVVGGRTRVEKHQITSKNIIKGFGTFCGAELSNGDFLPETERLAGAERSASGVERRTNVPSPKQKITVTQRSRAKRSESLVMYFLAGFGSGSQVSFGTFCKVLKRFEVSTAMFFLNILRGSSSKI